MKTYNNIKFAYKIPTSCTSCFPIGWKREFDFENGLGIAKGAVIRIKGLFAWFQGDITLNDEAMPYIINKKFYLPTGQDEGIYWKQ